MATLNQIAENIAIQLKDRDNYLLKETIKDEIKFLRARLIRQDAERNGLDSFYTQPVVLKLKKVDIADTCVVNIGCPVLVSENPIPQPIRIKSNSYFSFVGSVDGKVIFTPLKVEALNFINKEDIKDEIFFDYINNHIYIYNNIRLKEFKTIAAWTDPSKVKDDCSDVKCYSDDAEFPLPDDLLTIAIDIIMQRRAQLGKLPNEQVDAEKEL